MNYIKHLSGFFERVSTDHRLNPTHVSLYVSLFQFWNVQRFANPISISRDEVMKVSKICAKATYHKCMKELHGYGYLNYQPSYNPFKGSLVTLFTFEKKEPAFSSGRPVQNTARKQTDKKSAIFQTSPEQVVNRQQTGTEQALVPSINNTNITNSSNVSNLGGGANTHSQEKKINSGKKKTSEFAAVTKLVSTQGAPRPAKDVQKIFGKSVQLCDNYPTLQQVQEYFSGKKYPAIEAEKFFNHFTANGWLVSGRTPMKDWYAAARNWMLNIDRFNHMPGLRSQGAPAQQKQITPGNLHATTEKNYNEPL